ncbi:hypothetical protein [Sneathiella sp.]|jgi:hypothetical protein|uniref:hypothetical protein n=1 Tax=Sneathiella sp. TaxID=1964365 RepID=UPI0039E27C3B
MSNKTKMTGTRFSEILDAYGARTTQWPAEEVSAAQELLQQSSDARKMLQNAETLDRLIDDQTAPVSASGALLGRILEQADLQKKTPGPLWHGLISSFLKPAAGLVLATCLGITVGIIRPDLIDISDEINFEDLSVTDPLLEWENINDNG